MFFQYLIDHVHGFSFLMYVQKNAITPLGRHLVEFSCPANMAKCLLFASLLCCLDPVLTILSSLVRLLLSCVFLLGYLSPLHPRHTLPFLCRRASLHFFRPLRTERKQVAPNVVFPLVKVIS